MNTPSALEPPEETLVDYRVDFGALQGRPLSIFALLQW